MYLHVAMSPKTYSTADAAKMVGISRATLHAWIGKGKVPFAPKPQRIGNVVLRLWTASQVGRLRKVKEQVYRKEMGRPKQ